MDFFIQRRIFMAVSLTAALALIGCGFIIGLLYGALGLLLDCVADPLG